MFAASGMGFNVDWNCGMEKNFGAVQPIVANRNFPPCENSILGEPDQDFSGEWGVKKKLVILNTCWNSMFGAIYAFFLYKQWM